GDLPVGSGFPAGNGSGELVDALVEGRDAAHVESNARKVAVPSAQLRGYTFDGDFDERRRAHFACLGIKAKQATAGCDFPLLGQMPGKDAGSAPNNTATPSAGMEDCVRAPRHNATPSPRGS